jgi:hypothetical protein
MGACVKKPERQPRSCRPRTPFAERDFEVLLVEVGNRTRIASEVERSALSVAQRLRLQALERRILWSLPTSRRRQLAGEGRLSVYQRSVWAIAAPEEVPWVNGGIPPWLISTLCDIVDEGDG